MSNDPVEAGLRARLQLFVDDPMWADHAEVPKHLLRTTIATLAAKDAEIAGLRDENFALSANACPAGYGDDWGRHQCRLVDEQRERASAAERELVAARAALPEEYRTYDGIDNAVGLLSRELAEAKGEIERLRQGLSRLSRSATAFLRYFNPHNLAEDKSQQWFSVFDQIERARALALTSKGGAE